MELPSSVASRKFALAGLDRLSQMETPMRTMYDTLERFATQIEDDRKSKEDFEVKTTALDVRDGDPNKIAFSGNEYTMSEHFRRQLYERLGIPYKYAETMRSKEPGLFADSLRTWWRHDGGERRTVRTLRGKARAYLSDRYNIIDNEQIAEQVLPILGKIDGAEFHSLAITEDRMHIKVVSPRLRGEVVPGDAVQLGLSITNSEIGAGAFKIEPLLFRLVCRNGMIREDDAFRMTHVGGRKEYRGPAWKIDTQRAESVAAVLKGRDVVNAMLRPETLDGFLRPLREAAGVKLAAPTEAVAAVTKLGGLSESESDGVLAHLIQGGDITKYGLVQAVTRYSQDIEDYERADYFERLGSRVLSLPPTEFKRMKEAA